MSRSEATLPQMPEGRALSAAWAGKLLGIRNRWLASPRFQSWAARFPLTRPFARQHARALFDLCAGFVYSQILLSCVQLRVFEVLGEGPQDSATVAARCGLSVDASRRLLEAAASLQLLERTSGDRFGLGILGAALSANPAVLAMIRHHPMLYRDLGDPVALLRGTVVRTELADYWAYARNGAPAALDATETAAYTTLMTDSQPLVAAEVLDGYPVHRHRRVLDVGGGEGGFLLSVAERAPHLELQLFDLPSVVVRAQARFAAAGLGRRASVAGGDFLAGPLPGGADLVTLIRVLHDHDDAAVLTLLANVLQALPPGGTVLIAEPLANTPGAETVGAAYFAFYFLAMGQGRARTQAELTQLLRRAGFVDVRLRPTAQALQTGLLSARRPAG